MNIVVEDLRSDEEGTLAVEVRSHSVEARRLWHRGMPLKVMQPPAPTRLSGAAPHGQPSARGSRFAGTYLPANQTFCRAFVLD